MATAIEGQASKLALEIKDLQKKRGEIEYELRGIENKEKAQQNALLGKRGRTNDSNITSKRFREGDNRRNDLRRNEEERRGVERDRNDRDNNKPSRLSSVAVGLKKDSRDPRDSRNSHDNSRQDNSGRSREESRRPKLSSTIGGDGSSGISEKRSTLDVNDEETKKRSKNMFNKVLLGTLKSFKSASDAKSEAEQRRLELEQKVQQKVKDEQEKSVEEQKRALQEQKDKGLALREEIKQQLEQKELELLNLKWGHHREQLSRFIKTETKPHIYYKPAKVEPKSNKEKSVEDSKLSNSTQDNQTQ